MFTVTLYNGSSPIGGRIYSTMEKAEAALAQYEHKAGLAHKQADEQGSVDLELLPYYRKSYEIMNLLVD